MNIFSDVASHDLMKNIKKQFSMKNVKKKTSRKTLDFYVHTAQRKREKIILQKFMKKVHLRNAIHQHTTEQSKAERKVPDYFLKNI